MSAGGRTKHLARETAESSAGAGRILLELAVSPLPERWRLGLEDRFTLNVDRVAMASGFLQWLIFLALWALGLEWWMLGLTQPLQGPLDSDKDMYSFAMLWMNPALPIVYTFMSPVGFLAALGTLGGALRLFYGAAHRQNAADPTLALVDHVLNAWRRRRGARSRERSKGTPSPDRVSPGGPEDPFDLRILSCEDYPWPEGSTVRVLGRMYQLLEARELKDEQGRLRLAYTFKLIEGAGVVRGLQVYSPAREPLVKHGT